MILSAEIVDAHYTADLIQKVIEHLCGLCARVETVKRALFVINVEANYGQVASDVERGLRERAPRTPLLPRFVVLQEDKRKRGAGGIGTLSTDLDPVVTAGTRTTARTKIQMVEVMNGLLRGGHVFFARPFLQHLAADAPVEKDLREEIITEMLNYKSEVIYVKPSGNRPARKMRKFSGKHGGLRDDFVMSVMICTLVIELFQRSDKYVNVRGL